MPEHTTPETIRPRRYPFPFEGACAFVTDIDGTTFPSFIRTHRAFYGLDPAYEGVELELANSFWLMAARQRTLRNSIYLLELDGSERPFVRDRLRPFMTSPLFDSIHSYGDFDGREFTRARAEQCVAYALEHEIRPPFWTFHGSKHEVHNIRVGDDHWTGDDPASEAYHLDLLNQLAIRYYRVPPSLDLTYADATREVVAARDGTKLMLQKCHATIEDVEDPQALHEWIDYLEKVGLLDVPRRSIFQANRRFPNKILTWHPELLAVQLDQTILDRALADQRTLFINQHLSRAKSNFAYDFPRTIEALRRLSEFQRSGRMLVTGSARLITFEVVRDHADITVETDGDRQVVTIDPTVEIDGWRLPLTPNDVEGIGWAHPSATTCVMKLGTQTLSTATVDEADGLLTHVPWTSRLAAQRDAITEFAATFGSEDG